MTSTANARPPVSSDRISDETGSADPAKVWAAQELWRPKFSTFQARF